MIDWATNKHGCMGNLLATQLYSKKYEAKDMARIVCRKTASPTAPSPSSKSWRTNGNLWWSLMRLIWFPVNFDKTDQLRLMWLLNIAYTSVAKPTTSKPQRQYAPIIGFEAQIGVFAGVWWFLLSCWVYPAFGWCGVAETLHGQSRPGYRFNMIWWMNKWQTQIKFCNKTSLCLCVCADHGSVSTYLNSTYRPLSVLGHGSQWQWQLGIRSLEFMNALRFFKKLFVESFRLIQGRFGIGETLKDSFWCGQIYVAESSCCRRRFDTSYTYGSCWDRAWVIIWGKGLMRALLTSFAGWSLMFLTAFR